ncbi:MAG TPA: hypothetical protein PK859_18880 [Spirochaetota bacterium]|nr:hypothetical protein [Spirochaetota bacterium]HPR50075.1 hypothetical protein [Spirochaetota bacterium]
MKHRAAGLISIMMIFFFALAFIPACDDDSGSGGGDGGTVESFVNVEIDGVQRTLVVETVMGEELRINDDGQYAIKFRYSENQEIVDLIAFYFPSDVLTGDIYNQNNFARNTGFFCSYINGYEIGSAYSFSLTVTEWGTVARGTFSGLLYSSYMSDIKNFTNGTFQFPVEL